jgi:hypothetical protein
LDDVQSHPKREAAPPINEGAMTDLLKRPALSGSQTAGPLGFEQIQSAYVTNDIDRARDVLRARYGLASFHDLTAHLPEGGDIEVSLAWAGRTLYELISARGPGTEFYTNNLPKTRFAIRHHHLGFLVPDEKAWDTLERQIARDAWRIVFQRDAPQFMRACYIEAPELGHYLEYLLLRPAAVALFESVPCH